MAKKHIEKGASMPYINAGSTTIAAGTLILVGDMVGVALGDIAAGAEGQLATEEVWEVPKEAPLVIDQGDQVYWDDTNSVVTKTDTDVACGVAFVGAASAATTVKIKLNV